MLSVAVIRSIEVVETLPTSLSMDETWSNHALQRFGAIGNRGEEFRGTRKVRPWRTEPAGASESTVPAASAVSSPRTAGLSNRSVPPSLSLGR